RDLTVTGVQTCALPIYRDYGVAGQRPATVTGPEADRLRTFAADPTLAAASDPLGPHGSFVHYVRVGDSHFVILVERPYPWPLNEIGRASCRERAQTQVG